MLISHLSSFSKLNQELFLKMVYQCSHLIAVVYTVLHEPSLILLQFPCCWEHELYTFYSIYSYCRWKHIIFIELYRNVFSYALKNRFEEMKTANSYYCNDVAKCSKRNKCTYIIIIWIKYWLLPLNFNTTPVCKF